jgi:AcrR family transcriptional regulator
VAQQAEPTSAVRARTRRAILDAAVRVLSANNAAPLGAVAAEAGVGRTTLHRYFPERDDLVKALSADALQRASAATQRARLEEGPAREALERLCQELFELDDLLTLIFNDPQLMSTPDWQEESETDRALMGLIERGQADGTIDPTLPSSWLQYLVWALLYTVWEHSRHTQAPRHEALSLCLRTLRRVLAPTSS